MDGMPSNEFIKMLSNYIEDPNLLNQIFFYLDDHTLSFMNVDIDETIKRRYKDYDDCFKRTNSLIFANHCLQRGADPIHLFHSLRNCILTKRDVTNEELRLCREMILIDSEWKYSKTYDFIWLGTYQELFVDCANLKVIKLLREMNRFKLHTKSLTTAIKRGYNDIAYYYMDNFTWNYCGILILAINCRNNEITEHLLYYPLQDGKSIMNGANSLIYNYVFNTIIRSNSMSLLKLFIHNGIELKEKHLCKAIKYNSYDVFVHIQEVKKFPLNNLLYTACSFDGKYIRRFDIELNRMRFVEYLIKAGATNLKKAVKELTHERIENLIEKGLLDESFAVSIEK